MVDVFIDLTFSISKSKSSSLIGTGFDLTDRNLGGMTMSIGDDSTPDKERENDFLFGVECDAEEIGWEAVIDLLLSRFTDNDDDNVDEEEDDNVFVDFSPGSLCAPILFLLYHK